MTQTTQADQSSSSEAGRQTVLVTGAAGFIGSHSAEALVARGYRVIGVDNFCDFYDRSWKEMNLKSIRGGSAMDVEEIDITDGERIDRLVAQDQAGRHPAPGGDGRRAAEHRAAGLLRRG